MTDYDRSLLRWRQFSAQLQRKAAAAQKLADSLTPSADRDDIVPHAIASACAMIYQEIAEMALTISKGQG